MTTSIESTYNTCISNNYTMDILIRYLGIKDTCIRGIYTRSIFVDSIKLNTLIKIKDNISRSKDK